LCSQAEKSTGIPKNSELAIAVFLPHKLQRIIHNAPNLLLGYNIYVDTDKLRLIDHAYTSVLPSATSFVDLGGIWKVNAAYSLYTLKQHSLPHGVLVDTDIPPRLHRKLSENPNLRVVRGDFGRDDVLRTVGAVDVAYFFDVLLHQASPSWDRVLADYSSSVKCVVIYNQQYIRSQSSLRLTHLPLEEYLTLAPHSREDIYRYAYAHAEEIHPLYQKPWLDIHNIFQWGITDYDLRSKMAALGFREAYFKNYGQFSNLKAFENHGFIFLRDPSGTV
jgi:hypothetical protein